MANIKVVNKAGEQVSELTLSDAIFSIEPNTSAMHIAVVNYLAISVRAHSQLLLVQK